MLLSPEHILIRLLAAWVCGIILGIERRSRGKQIGISTYVLISLTACSIAIASAYGFQDSAKSDPARLVVGIITGMGFLGAGVIWRSPHGRISGLTTAADLWATACLGILWGLGNYFLATATFVLIISTLMIAKHSKLIKPRIRRMITTDSPFPRPEAGMEENPETIFENSKKNTCQNEEKPL